MNQPLSLQLRTEQPLIAKTVPSQRIIELALTAPQAQPRADRAPLNLALVIDRSGSMSGDKLGYAIQAAHFVVDSLQETDRVALVTFEHEVELVAPSTLATAAAKADLKNRLDAIEIAGSTFLSGGWLAGCQEVAAHLSEGSVNRVLLLTDGEANVGIREPEELFDHARELYRRGVSTSTFGVGLGFHEHLLEGMANLGGGSFYFISSPVEIPVLFSREFSELSTITARGVELEITIPAGVAVEVLGDYPCQEQDGKRRIALGDLTGGHSRELYLKLLLPPVLAGAAEAPLVVQARAMGLGLENQVLESQAEVRFTYTEPQALAQAAPDSAVQERFAKVYVAQRASEALKLERAGRREEAQRRLQEGIVEMEACLAPEVLADYNALTKRMQRPLEEWDRKASQYRTYREKRGRRE